MLAFTVRSEMFKRDEEVGPIVVKAEYGTCTFV